MARTCMGEVCAGGRSRPGRRCPVGAAPGARAVVERREVVVVVLDLGPSRTVKPSPTKMSSMCRRIQRRGADGCLGAAGRRERHVDAVLASRRSSSAAPSSAVRSASSPSSACLTSFACLPTGPRSAGGSSDRAQRAVRSDLRPSSARAAPRAPRSCRRGYRARLGAQLVCRSGIGGHPTRDP